MKLIRYSKAEHFIEDNMEMLMENEAQNNLIIGNALRGRDAGSEGFYMSSVKDSLGVVLSAIITPPFNLVIYCRDNAVVPDAVELLADNLIEELVYVPGVLSEKKLADYFTAYYSGKTGKDYSLNHSMSIMYTESVKPSVKASGYLREATTDDLHYLVYWASAFSIDCNIEQFTLSQQYERTKNRVDAGNVFIWQDGCPVSTAAKAREMKNGIVLNFVYTPPFYRGKGYATACVSSLTALLLEKRKFCCLFVDNTNPISNRIYQNIGYDYICDYSEYKFKSLGT